MEEFGDHVEGYGLGDPFDADPKGIFAGFVSEGKGRFRLTVCVGHRGLGTQRTIACEEGKGYRYPFHWIAVLIVELHDKRGPSTFRRSSRSDCHQRRLIGRWYYRWERRFRAKDLSLGDTFDADFDGIDAGIGSEGERALCTSICVRRPGSSTQRAAACADRKGYRRPFHRFVVLIADSNDKGVR